MRWGRLRPSVLRVLGIPFLAQPARLSIGYSPEISLRSVGKCRNIASPLVHGIVGAIARFRRLSPLSRGVRFLTCFGERRHSGLVTSGERIRLLKCGRFPMRPVRVLVVDDL